MKKLVSVLLLFTLVMGHVNAQGFQKEHKHNIKPLSATKFEVTNKNFENPKIVDMAGKDFILVSVREPGSDGELYAVDRDGTIWWHGTIASGAAGGHETTNGMFKILAKRRFHMSKTHPSANGVNNMDFELQFTQDGQALHLGHTYAMSHGCIHVGRQDIAAMFKWAHVGLPVIIMRGHYKQFLVKEINQFKEDLREYDAETGSIGEKY